VEKKLHWHTTFGKIEVIEPIYRRPGQRIRPFSQSAEVVCRGCSLPLQRVVTDFGADHPFAQVPSKLQEHYGFTLSPATIRHVSEHHAKQVSDKYKKIETYPLTSGVAEMIVETDGSMIPIVTTDPEQADQRKGKTYGWKEARLSLAHAQGSVTPRFGVEFQQGVEAAGKALFDCACQAGFGRKTYVHAVGDGAPWIVGQIEQHFGAQGHYLVDFYHISECFDRLSTST
jgi:hypothetical protein